MYFKDLDVKSASVIMSYDIYLSIDQRTFEAIQHLYALSKHISGPLPANVAIL